MIGGMKRIFLLAAAGAIAITLTGCVELTGQRIAWRYDAGADTLEALLFYDGVHNSKDEDADAPQQLADFVRNGDVMIADWFLHWQLGELRRAADDANADPATRQLGEALKSVTVRTIGHYREPGGRIGAAQLVTIAQARRFVEAINGSLNRALSENAEQNPPAEDGFRRTQEAIAKAAKAGHSWLAIDGQALRVTVPVDDREWAANKGKVLTQLFNPDGNERGEEERRGMRLLAQLLSATPVSYVERSGAIDVTIGRTDQTSVLRFDIRDAYSDNLAKALTDAAPTYLDAQVADWLLAGAPADKSPAGVKQVVEFGPPEAHVAALLSIAQRLGDEPKAEAAKRLAAFGDRWRDGPGLPEIPPTMDDRAAYFDAWRGWYGAMKSWPLEPVVPEPVPPEAQPVPDAPVAPKVP